MKIKLFLEKATGFEFKATVYEGELTDEHLQLLGLQRDEDWEREFEVYGDYTVEWDVDIPMVTIQNVTVFNNEDYKKNFDLNLDDIVNYDELCQQIEEMDSQVIYESQYMYYHDWD